MRTWSLLCVCITTGVGHTDSESAQHFWLGKTKKKFLCSWRDLNLRPLDLESDVLPSPLSPSTSWDFGPRLYHESGTNDMRVCSIVQPMTYLIYAMVTYSCLRASSWNAAILAAASSSRLSPPGTWLQLCTRSCPCLAARTNIFHPLPFRFYQGRPV